MHRRHRVVAHRIPNLFTLPGYREYKTTVDDDDRCVNDEECSNSNDNVHPNLHNNAKLRLESDNKSSEIRRLKMELQECRRMLSQKPIDIKKAELKGQLTGEKRVSNFLFIFIYISITIILYQHLSLSMTS